MLLSLIAATAMVVCQLPVLAEVMLAVAPVMTVAVVAAVTPAVVVTAAGLMLCRPAVYAATRVVAGHVSLAGAGTHRAESAVLCLVAAPVCCAKTVVQQQQHPNACIDAARRAAGTVPATGWMCQLMLQHLLALDNGSLGVVVVLVVLLLLYVIRTGRRAFEEMAGLVLVLKVVLVQHDQMSTTVALVSAAGLMLVELQ